ncbi:MAG: acylneuraminate cytidylyltransferase family protein [Methanothrix sp.]|nr:acylneuraminate cytidylyltransferase family protein [Methanothrix sp.]
MNKKIIAIIPARGGSKGLPRKNIAMLRSRPLISYSIEAALRSNLVSRVIVTTEDAEIAEVSRKYGSEVIDRPMELAQDDTPIISVVRQAIHKLEDEGYFAEVIALLQPTSPLRTTEDIDGAIQLFQTNNCGSVVSICEMEHSPYWSFKVERNYLKPLMGKKYLNLRRQDLPKVYMPNGAIFVSSPRNLYEIGSFYSHETMPYIMPAVRSIDIDCENDLLRAEIQIKNSLSIASSREEI